MDCNTPGFPVHHQLLEFAQTHVHWVGDAIQPYHLLLSPSPAFNLCQHQGLFQMSQFFTSGGPIFGASASASVLSVNIQDWFPLELTGLISLQSKELSRVFSNTTVQKHQFFSTQLSYGPTLASIHDYWKNHSFDSTNFCGQVMSLLFNMLFRFVIVFFPRSKCLFISWLQSPTAVILEPNTNKVCHCFHCFPIYLPWSDGTGCHDFSFLNVEF